MVLEKITAQRLASDGIVSGAYLDISHNRETIDTKKGYESTTQTR